MIRFRLIHLILIFILTCLAVFLLFYFKTTNPKIISKDFQLSSEHVINAADEPPKNNESSPLNKFLSKTRGIDSLETNSVEENTSKNSSESLDPEVRIEKPVAPTSIEETFETFWMGFGVGVNLQRYSQTISGTSDLVFTSIEGPTLFAEIGSFYNETWGAVVNYKDTPGKATSLTIPLNNGKYHWRTLAIEGLYSLNTKNYRSGSSPSQLILKLGLQTHIVPFMAALDSDIDVREHLLYNLAAGMQYILGAPAKRVKYLFEMRYQYLLGASATDGDSFSITPKFAFDGGLAMLYDLNPHWNLGLHWYGQWHEYKFDFKDKATDVSNTGQQSLFYTNIDFRIRYTF